MDSSGIERKMKPLLIAYQLLWNESIMLVELEESKDESEEEIKLNTVSKRITTQESK